MPYIGLVNKETHMATKHHVTDSRGQVHKRTSQNRVYSHCIVAHCKEMAREGREPWPAHSTAHWASSLARAQATARQCHRYWGFESVEIIEAIHG